MKAGVNAGVRDFIAVVLQARPLARDSSSSRARQRDREGEVERGLVLTPSPDVMRATVFSMYLIRTSN